MGNKFPQKMANGKIAKSDKQIMEHPEGWWHYPSLPVKRKNDDDPTGFGWELGIIHRVEPTTVYRGNLFTGLEQPEKKYYYPTTDDLLTDGWITD